MSFMRSLSLRAVASLLLRWSSYSMKASWIFATGSSLKFNLKSLKALGSSSTGCGDMGGDKEDRGTAKKKDWEGGGRNRDINNNNKKDRDFEFWGINRQN